MTNRSRGAVSVAEALALVADRILPGAEVDEDVVAVHGDREPPKLVGKLIEGAIPDPGRHRGRGAKLCHRCVAQQSLAGPLRNRR